MADFTRSIPDIVEVLKNLKDSKNIGCSLLIGAGCSYTADIPLAQGFVDIIEDKWPVAHGRASKADYPHCIEELAPQFQHELITDAIKISKINWAHICIAVLIQKGYVDRVLTTNFDPLISRACALLGEFPAVYDFASSQTFKPELVPDKAIFHLHGQHTGFVMLHDRKKNSKYSKSLTPLFDDASQGRLWIVVGYSGENDPVFDDHLTKIKVFQSGLYWIGFKDELKPHVRDELLSKRKKAYHIPGHDADSFFIELTRELEIFPPDFITKPFHHLHDLFDGIQPFPSKEGFSEKDVTEAARQQISRAMKHAEEDNQKRTAEANRLLMSGDYKATLNFINKNKVAHATPEFLEIEAWAYIGQGNQLSELAETQSGPKQQSTFKLAGDKFQQAIKIKPDKHEAFNNWGIALTDLARTQSGAKQQATFKLAGDKFQQAIKIKPDDHDAFYNWGNALADLARTQSGSKQQATFKLAGDKFQQAIKIKPEIHEAFYNWGIALADLARTQSGAKQQATFKLAGDKFQQAIKIKPDKYEAFNNWGNALAGLARTQSGAKQQATFKLAGDKFQQAIKIKPDDHDALFNMACVEALRGSEAECQKWLGKLVKIEPLTRERANDSDLDSVRDKAWFKKLVG